MSRFVRPDVAILKISQGDTLTVKRRLSSGEQREVYARMYTAGADGAMRLNPFQSGLALITAYLVDWSLTDDDGHVVVIRDQPLETVTAAINLLDHESFTEIKEAIEQHERAMVQEREQARADPFGETAAAAISPSQSAPAGMLTGSEP